MSYHMFLCKRIIEVASSQPINDSRSGVMAVSQFDSRIPQRVHVPNIWVLGFWVIVNNSTGFGVSI